MLSGGVCHILCKILQCFFCWPWNNRMGIQHTHCYYQLWKPDGPKCNCFNGGNGEGSLKDWLKDLVSRWTNQRGSQGHSQGPRQTNIPVSSLSRPWTRALLHSHALRETKTHLESSHTSLCFQPETPFYSLTVVHPPTGLEPITNQTHHLLASDFIWLSNVSFRLQ